jgi:hypothetical protein
MDGSFVRRIILYSVCSRWRLARVRRANMTRVPFFMPGAMLLDPLFAARVRGGAAPAAPATSDSGPRVFLLQGEELHAARARVRGGDEKLKPALRTLQEDARAAMKVGPFAVTTKAKTPPSGDKHDFMSLAPYWWPDPEKADGLPYVQRDGERNPEIYEISDAGDLKRMAVAAETLAAAWYFTGDEAFADRAALLLRTWFLAPETRMNPHLRYAQAIPGTNDGRGIGIIESVYLIFACDAAGMLHGSSKWTDADERGLREWFTQYLRWMRESKNGRDEAAAKNNHGTFYDVQVATFALFTDQRDLAREVIERVPAKRIAMQVEPDGRQPLELKRTKAWSYSLMNTRGLMLLARLGEHVGVDLWHAHPPAHGGIRDAVQFLAPFATGEKPWSYDQINGFRNEGALVILRRAARVYPEDFAGTLKKLPPLPEDATERLTGERLVGNPLDSK